ncbi:CLUMA_CG003649, isoform A [Clunio marinus]|uniref:CLUMA_CG003649, isoform A n=1 Tax=Clunio marinus TaxID=568069 RepID=A0A1J1HTV7_9DIPT|nr:CLUMA_CG003649, isoform A [Clunio marinus]
MRSAFSSAVMLLNREKAKKLLSHLQKTPLNMALCRKDVSLRKIVFCQLLNKPLDINSSKNMLS